MWECLFAVGDSDPWRSPEARHTTIAGKYVVVEDCNLLCKSIFQLVVEVVVDVEVVVVEVVVDVVDVEVVDDDVELVVVVEEVVLVDVVVDVVVVTSMHSHTYVACHLLLPHLLSPTQVPPVHLKTKKNIIRRS